MTDAEKTLQRVQLGVELENAEGDFAHLRENAFRIAQGLRSAASKVEAAAVLQPSAADFTLDTELGDRLTPQHQAAMDYISTNLLLEKLRTVRQNLHNLQLRKNNLLQPSNMKIPMFRG